MNGSFVWEIRKSVRPRTLIILPVVLIAILILSAASFDMSLKMVSESGTSAGPTYRVYTEEELAAAAKKSSDSVARLEKAYEKDKRLYGDLFRQKSLQKEYEFASEGYAGKKIRISGEAFSGPMPAMSATAESFLEFYMSLLVGFFMIWGMLYGWRLYITEYDSGTIKAVMTRPVTKNRITAVKLGSMCAVLSVAYFAAALVGFAYGAIKYGTVGGSTVIYSFNAMSAAAATEGAAAFGRLMEGLISVLFLSVTSFSLSTIARRWAAGVIPALMITFKIGSLLDGWGMAAFTISNSLEFMRFFGASQAVVRNGNFFISLSILAVCTAALLTAVFVVTDRRDVD